MSQLKSAYDASIYKGANQTKESNAIDIALATGDLVADPDTRLVMIELDTGAIKDIPSFNHPLPITYKGEQYVAVDLRFFVKRNAHGERIIINPNEYQLQVNAGLLNVRWLAGHVRPILSSHTAILAIYANLISRTLTRRMQLDHREQEYVRVLFAYFYACQFFDALPSASEQVSVIRLIGRALRVSDDTVVEIVAENSYIGSLRELCEIIKSESQSVRLARLEPGAVINQLSSVWFGVAANRTIAVALEFPPMWIAILSVAISYKIYRKTGVALAIESVLNRNTLPQFTSTLKYLIQPTP